MKNKFYIPKISVVLLAILVSWLVLLKPAGSSSQASAEVAVGQTKYVLDQYIIILDKPDIASTSAQGIVKAQRVGHPLSLDSTGLPPLVEEKLKGLGVVEATYIGKHSGYERMPKSSASNVVSQSNIFLLKLSPGSNLDKFAEEALQVEGIAAGSRNYIYKAQFVPNDSKYSLQWALPRIKAPQAWDLETGSSSTKIAIIDTGCDMSHPDLALNLNPSLSFDFVNDDPDPEDDSEDSHGTHVAGIIAAVGDNGKGVTGLNWKADLVIYKALDKDGLGTLDKLIAAIGEAIDNDVGIINMSWGTEEDSPVLKEVLQEAYAAGVVLVAAAGNAGKILYPAKYQEVLAVGGTGKGSGDPRWVTSIDGQKFESAFGPEVDVSAPAEDVLSTIKNVGVEELSYGSLSGTSMSAAFVSGEAGLILSQKSNLRNTDVYQIIQDNVDSVTTDADKPIGAGRINVFKAVEAASSFIPTPTPTPSPTPPSGVPEDEAWIEGVVEGESGGIAEPPVPVYSPLNKERITYGGNLGRKASSDNADSGPKPLAGIKVVARATYLTGWGRTSRRLPLPRRHPLPSNGDGNIGDEIIAPEPGDFPGEGDIIAEATTDENGHYKLVISQEALQGLGAKAYKRGMDSPAGGSYPIGGEYKIQVTAGGEVSTVEPPYAIPYPLAKGVKTASTGSAMMHLPAGGGRFPLHRSIYGSERYLPQTQEIEIELGQEYTLDFLLRALPAIEPREPIEPPETPNGGGGGGGCGGGANVNAGQQQSGAQP